MKEINLREYYPFYNMDVYLEVSDEIAGQLDLSLIHISEPTRPY